MLSCLSLSLYKFQIRQNISQMHSKNLNKSSSNSKLLQLNVYHRCVKNKWIQLQKQQHQSKLRHAKVSKEAVQIETLLHREKLFLEMQYSDLLDQLHCKQQETRILQQAHGNSAEELQQNKFISSELLRLADELAATKTIISSEKSSKKFNAGQQDLDNRIRQNQASIIIVREQIQEDTKLYGKKLKEARLAREQYQNTEQDYFVAKNTVKVLQQRIEQRKKLNHSIKLQQEEKRAQFQELQAKIGNKKLQLQERITEEEVNYNKGMIKQKIAETTAELHKNQQEVQIQKEELIKQVLLKQNSLHIYRNLQQNLKEILEMNRRLNQLKGKYEVTSQKRSKSKILEQTHKENMSKGTYNLKNLRKSRYASPLPQ